MPTTIEEHKAHLLAGVGENCLVCECHLYGSWTDYNGQIRCHTCGTTYQVLGSHHNAEFLERLGITKGQVAKIHCDCFTCVPMLRDYWQETSRPIPFGSFLGGSPIPEEQYKEFYSWLAAHADKYEADYADEFNWDAVRKSSAPQPATT
jgi:hypothetical protein